MVYPIAGASTVSLYSSTTFSDATPSGTWSSSNPSVATVTASGTVLGVATGTATITYSVTDACGTTAVTKTITITGSLSEHTVLGSNSGLAVTLSPNPANDIINISCSLNGAGNVSVNILDLSGSKIYGQQAYVNKTGSISIPLNNIAAGVYLVEVMADGDKIVKMLVKN